MVTFYSTRLKLGGKLDPRLARFDTVYRDVKPRKDLDALSQCLSKHFKSPIIYKGRKPYPYIETGVFHEDSAASAASDPADGATGSGNRWAVGATGQTTGTGRPFSPPIVQGGPTALVEANGLRMATSVGRSVRTIAESWRRLNYPVNSPEWSIYDLYWRVYRAVKPAKIVHSPVKLYIKDYISSKGKRQ